MADEKRPWFMKPVACDACAVPSKPGHPPCGQCKRNPINAGKKRLHDWFHPKAGDDGDCGNWAIACQRVLGGDLMALYDGGDDDEVIDPPLLAHVVVVKGGLVIDAYGAVPVQAFYDRLDSCGLAVNDELEPITEAEVFERLEMTSEARIAELMEAV